MPLNLIPKLYEPEATPFFTLNVAVAVEFEKFDNEEGTEIDTKLKFEFEVFEFDICFVLRDSDFEFTAPFLFQRPLENDFPEPVARINVCRA